MEYYGKDKKIYKGIGIAFIFLMLFPLAVFALLYAVFETHTTHPQIIKIVMSMGYAGIAGALFCLICLGNGLIEYEIKSLIDRIKTFVYDVRIFKGQAVKWYFASFWKDGGIIIWLFVLWFSICVFFAVFGFTYLLNWYYAQKA